MHAFNLNNNDRSRLKSSIAYTYRELLMAVSVPDMSCLLMNERIVSMHACLDARRLKEFVGDATRQVKNVRSKGTPWTGPSRLPH